MPLAVRAEEGFWPFNLIPRAEIEKRYGLKIADAWLEKVRLASLRFNSGGSGSFVSPHGLVMTNHHIATEFMQKISDNQNDFVKNGFHARTIAEERKVPDAELNQLISIEDVTDRVKAAVKPGMSTAESYRARTAAIAAIEKESLEKTGMRSDVVPLYRGADYHLYRFKKFTDVRLVFAPEVEIGFFGGDPDNFTYPRYDLDVAFFRVYENGKPYESPHWFAWSKAGAKSDELTIVSGNPGGTRRLNAVAELEFSRNFALPLEFKWLKHYAGVLHAYADSGADQARNSQEALFDVENELKDMEGQLKGLRNDAVMSRKREIQAALIKASDPATAKVLSAAYEVIAKARGNYKTFFKEFKLIKEGQGFNSELLERASTLVELAEEREKPDEQRLPEFTQARMESLEMQLFSRAPLMRDFEKIKLAKSLELLSAELGADHAVVKLALGGKAPAPRAAELVGGTKMTDVETRKRLAAGGRKAILESTDPMILLARALDPTVRELMRRFHEELETPEMQAYEVIAKAWKEHGGPLGYPDATFTPRLSFGRIKGYEDEGKWLEPFTMLGGLFERAAQHENKEPYVLTPNWLGRKAALDLKTPFNFVSTNDIIGGNSGSPVLNANAEIVGLVFDGNIYSLIGDFYYDETTNRTVSVDSRAIIEVLSKVYLADALVKELTGK
jgi:hypothetical protein